MPYSLAFISKSDPPFFVNPYLNFGANKSSTKSGAIIIIKSQIFSGSLPCGHWDLLGYKIDQTSWSINSSNEIHILNGK